MSRRAKIVISLLIFLALVLLVLRLNPRIPLSDSTILQFSSHRGYYCIVSTQLTLGVNPDGPDRTPLIEAIFNNNLRLATLVVEHGADLERQFMSGEPNGSDPNVMPMGVAPLHLAAACGDLQIAQMLVQAGAKKDVKAVGWWQPLGHPSAPPGKHRPYIAIGATPLDVVVGTKNEPLIRLLLIP